jgi:hypothetical protein
MQHIRKQDWFMVSVDLLVLIVGIFLGLQVSDWNEERKEKNGRRNFNTLSVSTTI